MSNKDKLWAGRFKESTDKIVEEYNASIGFDQKLALYDIKGSIAHAKMLAATNIITCDEYHKIESGLKTIEESILSGNFIFDISYEDIHMAIEKTLIDLIGSTGGKLHTARSRNDQVALDLRLFMRDGIDSILKYVSYLLEAIVNKAIDNKEVIMPGYTHLQIAQPILYAHYLMAYFQMFKRDYERFSDLRNRMNYSPLGSGALAGTTFPIDRFMVSDELKFVAPTENSIDGVSDRDFAVEFLSCSSIIIMHLSRFSEELIIHSSSEFSFIEISDGFSTGSSIMPQKKNPDIPELIRGKTGRIYGALISLLTTMKGLPLAYNKDMQEDKEPIFDTLKTIIDSVRIFTSMLEKVNVNKDIMYSASMKGYSVATDMADYLVRKGLDFRSAHHIVGQTVKYAIENNKFLHELSLDEFKLYTDLVSEDIYSNITIEACINNRNSYGGTSYNSVLFQIDSARKFIKSIAV